MSDSRVICLDPSALNFLGVSSRGEGKVEEGETGTGERRGVGETGAGVGEIGEVGGLVFSRERGGVGEELGEEAGEGGDGEEEGGIPSPGGGVVVLPLPIRLPFFPPFPSTLKVREGISRDTFPDLF